MSFVHTHTAPLSAPPEQVFRALTSSDALTRWFCEFAEVDAKVGGAYHFSGKYTPESDNQQRITEFVANEALAYTWRMCGVDTVVRLALAPTEKGTTLAITHEINGELGIPREREYVDDYWLMLVANLTQFLQHGNPVIRVDFTEQSPVVRHVITIDAPPADVFRALIEPDSVNKWFGSKTSVVEPVAGGRYDLGWKYKVKDRDVDGGPTKILEYVQDRKLVLDWREWRGDSSVTGQKITFLLDENADGGTTLTFVHDGFDRPTDVGDYQYGWTWFLGQLAGLFAKSGSPLSS